MKPGFPKKISSIQPFHVMDLLAKAQAMEQQGKSVIHLEIGEPDFKTPQAVSDAAIRAITDGKTRYTPATGLDVLKEKIAGYYATHFKTTISPKRIVITPGASGALLLALGALLSANDKIVLCDPGYPCNRNFARLFDAEVISVPVTADSGYNLTTELLQQIWQPGIKAVLVASPANPTGATFTQDELVALNNYVTSQGAVLIVDEIYQGLIYDGQPVTAAGLDEGIVVINSFSKYFSMTGWRLGWMVIPQDWLSVIDKLSQNLFLSPPTVSQYAALAAFDIDVIQELEQRRQIFADRLEYLYPAIRLMGFGCQHKPAGAFYLYADCSQHSSDSFHFANDLLEQAGVAITPGIDFGEYQANTHVRFAFTMDLALLEEAVSRISDYLSDYPDKS